VAIRTTVNPRGEHLKGASLWQALALPTNIRLGWKGSLAYFAEASMMKRIF